MRGRITRTAFAALAAVGVSVSMGLSQLPASAGSSGPDIKWDYSMQDNIGPSVTGTVGAEAGNPQDLTGMYVPQNKMTSDPDYPIAGNALYGTVPSDGKYPVTLDACATVVKGNAVYQWTIDGNFYATAECKVTRQLTEGTKNYTLAITDNTGVNQVSGTFVVKNVLVAIIGDSYASGEGFPPFFKPNLNPANGKPYEPDIPTAKNIVDWDETSCQRSRWSGWVRAANQMEKLDSHSSVTVIDVACAGAQITENKTYYGDVFGTTGGMLYPKRPLNDIGTVNDADIAKNPTIPSQIDQLNALRKGQKIDVGMLSMGGNDMGLSYIALTCSVAKYYITSCFSDGDPGNQTWEKVAKAMAPIPDKFAALADCLTGTGLLGECQTAKPGQPVGKETLTPSESLGIDPSNIIQGTYPSLTRDENGDLCNLSIGEDNDYTTPEELAQYAKGVGAPFKHGDSMWAEEVLIGGTGKPVDIPVWLGADSPLEAQFFPFPTDPLETVTVDTKGVKGLTSVFLDNVNQHGWGLAPGMFLDSINHGICASADQTIFYPIRNPEASKPPKPYQEVTWPVVGTTLNDLGVMHPNNKGQEMYRNAMFGPSKDQAGLPVPAKTQHNTQPVPPPINQPKNIKVKTLKNTCGPKYCHVKISFKKPKDGLDPKGYKVKTKVKGGAWRVQRARLTKTHFVWKKAPWKKGKFQMKIASYAWGNTQSGHQTQYINWTKAKTFKIKP